MTMPSIRRDSIAAAVAIVTAMVLGTALPGCGPSLADGDKLASQEDLEGATAIYRKVYEKKSTDRVALIKLARTLYLLDIAKKKQGQNPGAAEWKETYDLLERAHLIEKLPPEVDPVKEYELADSAYEAGLALAAEGKHAEALKLLEASKKNGKGGSKLFTAIAGCAEKTGDRNGAIDATLSAIEENTDDGLLVHKGALLAYEAGRLSDCHELMLVAEGMKPAGFKYMAPKDIKQMVSRSYFFLTTGLLETIFGTRRLESDRLKEWKANEALMTKNWSSYQKRPPEEVMKADKPYFLRVLYHLYVTHGYAHVLLCEFDDARSWWTNAQAIDKARYQAPSDVASAVVEDEKGWPEHNASVLDSMLGK